MSGISQRPQPSTKNHPQAIGLPVSMRTLNEAYFIVAAHLADRPINSPSLQGMIVLEMWAKLFLFY